MKTLIALIALALVSPGIYEIGKAVQTRRNADAQARYDAQQLRIAAEKKRTDEQAEIAAKAAAAAAELAKIEREKNRPSPRPIAVEIVQPTLRSMGLNRNVGP